MTTSDGHRAVALVVCYDPTYVQRDAGLADVKTDLLLKNLRGDPRFRLLPQKNVPRRLIVSSVTALSTSLGVN